MPLDQKKLQKKRAKREQKRKQAKSGNAGGGGLLSFASDWARAARAPIKDCFVPVGLFDQGIGTLWISRELADGRCAIAGFLLDVYCLGVKNALCNILEPDRYQQLLTQIKQASTRLHGSQSMESMHPSCARKLVEQSLAYALDLGFKPQADYRIAKLILEDIDASACPMSFTFGKDGKPFYCDGPNDTPAMKKSIIKQLERRCGPGGYDFLVSISDDSGALFDAD